MDDRRDNTTVRWQYRVANIGSFDTAARMVAVFGHLGEQGWELVGMYDKASNWWSGYEKGFAMFRRGVAPGTEPDGEWAVEVDLSKILPAGDAW